MKVCPMCGHENPDDEVFCELCQTNIREVPSAPRGADLPEEPVVYVKICPNCRSENEPGEVRCRTCGAFLTGVERTRKQVHHHAAPMKLKFASGAVLILTGRETMLGSGYQDPVFWGGDPYVSQAHLRIRQRDGKWYGEDISRNGTRRNGRILPKGEPVLLQNGDRLEAGRTGIRVELQEPAVAEGPGPGVRAGNAGRTRRRAFARI